MKTKYKPVPTEFAPETRFAVLVQPVGPFRATAETELERLKERLLRELLAELPQPEYNAPLRRACNDAAALAWTTNAPLLVFPELAREKAEAARRYTTRQSTLSQRGRAGVVQAA